jgi:DNA invertase Pin-like site-specific DNA recombinase
MPFPGDALEMAAGASKFVAYYRVPAQAHAKFGLGLEPQRIAMLVFLESRGGELAGEYLEVEEIDQKQRPMLIQALAACREMEATLFIPRLGELARDLGFIEGLIAGGVAVAAGDLPRVNLLELHAATASAGIKAEALLGESEKLLKKAREGIVRTT